MPRGGRKTGSKNRKTIEREKAKKIAALRAEISKNAPPIDFKAPLDSLEIMEGVMRHFYLRALIEQRMGPQADWSVVDALMLKTLAAAEKIARYRHASIGGARRWRHQRQDGRREPRRAAGHDQARVGQAEPADRSGRRRGMRGPRRAAGTSREANFNTTPATVCRPGK